MNGSISKFQADFVRHQEEAAKELEAQKAAAAMKACCQDPSRLELAINELSYTAGKIEDFLSEINDSLEGIENAISSFADLFNAERDSMHVELVGLAALVQAETAAILGYKHGKFALLLEKRMRDLGMLDL